MTQAMLKERTRRTQAERRASTRAKLLDATIACLIDLGYAGTTTTEIADRAGVSRGAQLHHFPTKADLVTTAVEHLFERRHREFLQAFACRPAGADAAAAAIDILWSMVSGPTFHAWLELAVAARTDAQLRERLASMGGRFMETVEHTFRELFPAPGAANPLFEIAPRFAFALLEGLALHQVAARDDGQVKDTLNALKAIARLVM
jgi:AcrR family transcriptional regulator